MAPRSTITPKAMPSHVAIFGNVALERQFCKDCQCLTLVVQHTLSCCGNDAASVKPAYYKRESQPEQSRRIPSPAAKQACLIRQDNKCLYCNRTFGSHTTYNKQLVVIGVEWDHFIPYALLQDNTTTNYVAACQICNGFKGDRCFQTVEEAQIYLQAQWARSI